jgi:flagellar assembly factor FliW
MKINTKYFGSVEVDDYKVINFTDGLYGFPDERLFVLIPFGEETDSILCMQSLSDENLAFVIADPYCFNSEYDPKILEADMQSLEIGEDTSVLFYVIMVVKDGLEGSRVNMRCPIFVNCDTSAAKQVILENKEYSMRHIIEIPKGSDAKC